MKKYYITSTLILAVIIGIGFYIANTVQKSRVNVSRAAVITELKELNRLETASFTIEKIIDAQNGTSGRIEEFLFGDRLLLIARGEVIAGIDLSKLNESNINIQDKKLELTLPAPQILITSLDNAETKVYDRRTGILAKGDKDLEGEARQEAEIAIKAAACEGRILDEASENARKQLIALFKALSFKSISITIPSGVCN